MGLILDLKITKMYLRGTACTHPQSSQQSESCSQAGGPHTDLGFFSSEVVDLLTKVLQCIFLSRLSGTRLTLVEPFWTYVSWKVCRKEQPCWPLVRQVWTLGYM